MDLAAKRILWGKCNNAGQICVAPDYILVPRSKQDEFIEGLKKAYKTLFPDSALAASHDGSIMNDSHFNRLSSLLDILEGRKDAARKRIDPTIVKNVQDGDSLLEEELFGPILPIIPVESLDKPGTLADVYMAVFRVMVTSNKTPQYAFTEVPNIKQRLIDKTQSGGHVFNDTFQQFTDGYQVMKHTYDTYTQLRSSIDTIPTNDFGGSTTSAPSF